MGKGRPVRDAGPGRGGRRGRPIPASAGGGATTSDESSPEKCKNCMPATGGIRRHYRGRKAPRCTAWKQMLLRRKDSDSEASTASSEHDLMHDNHRVMSIQRTLPPLREDTSQDQDLEMNFDEPTAETVMSPRDTKPRRRSLERHWVLGGECLQYNDSNAFEAYATSEDDDIAIVWEDTSGEDFSAEETQSRPSSGGNRKNVAPGDKKNKSSRFEEWNMTGKGIIEDSDEEYMTPSEIEYHSLEPSEVAVNETDREPDQVTVDCKDIKEKKVTDCNPAVKNSERNSRDEVENNTQERRTKATNELVGRKEWKADKETIISHPNTKQSVQSDLCGKNIKITGIDKNLSKEDEKLNEQKLEIKLNTEPERKQHIVFEGTTKGESDIQDTDFNIAYIDIKKKENIDENFNFQNKNMPFERRAGDHKIDVSKLKQSTPDDLSLCERPRDPGNEPNTGRPPPPIRSRALPPVSTFGLHLPSRREVALLRGEAFVRREAFGRGQWLRGRRVSAATTFQPFSRGVRQEAWQIELERRVLSADKKRTGDIAESSPQQSSRQVAQPPPNQHNSPSINPTSVEPLRTLMSEKSESLKQSIPVTLIQPSNEPLIGTQTSHHKECQLQQQKESPQTLLNANDLKSSEKSVQINHNTKETNVFQCTNQSFRGNSPPITSILTPRHHIQSVSSLGESFPQLMAQDGILQQCSPIVCPPPPNERQNMNMQSQIDAQRFFSPTALPAPRRGTCATTINRPQTMNSPSLGRRDGDSAIPFTAAFMPMCAFNHRQQRLSVRHTFSPAGLVHNGTTGTRRIAGCMRAMTSLGHRSDETAIPLGNSTLPMMLVGPRDIDTTYLMRGMTIPRLPSPLYSAYGEERSFVGRNWQHVMDESSEHPEIVEIHTNPNCVDRPILNYPIKLRSDTPTRTHEQEQISYPNEENYTTVGVETQSNRGYAKIQNKKEDIKKVTFQEKDGFKEKVTKGKTGKKVRISFKKNTDAISIGCSEEREMCSKKHSKPETKYVAVKTIETMSVGTETSRSEQESSEVSIPEKIFRIEEVLSECKNNQVTQDKATSASLPLYPINTCPNIVSSLISQISTETSDSMAIPDTPPTSPINAIISMFPGNKNYFSSRFKSPNTPISNTSTTLSKPGSPEPEKTNEVQLLINTANKRFTPNNSENARKSIHVKIPNFPDIKHESFVETTHTLPLTNNEGSEHTTQSKQPNSHLEQTVFSSVSLNSSNTFITSSALSMSQVSDKTNEVTEKKCNAVPPFSEETKNIITPSILQRLPSSGKNHMKVNKSFTENETKKEKTEEVNYENNSMVHLIEREKTISVDPSISPQVSFEENIEVSYSASTSLESASSAATTNPVVPDNEHTTTLTRSNSNSKFTTRDTNPESRDPSSERQEIKEDLIPIRVFITPLRKSSQVNLTESIVSKNSYNVLSSSGKFGNQSITKLSTKTKRPATAGSKSSATNETPKISHALLKNRSRTKQQSPEGEKSQNAEEKSHSNKKLTSPNSLFRSLESTEGAAALGNNLRSMLFVKCTPAATKLGELNSQVNRDKPDSQLHLNKGDLQDACPSSGRSKEDVRSSGKYFSQNDKKWTEIPLMGKIRKYGISSSSSADSSNDFFNASAILPTGEVATSENNNEEKSPFLTPPKHIGRLYFSRGSTTIDLCLEKSMTDPDLVKGTQSGDRLLESQTKRDDRNAEKKSNVAGSKSQREFSKINTSIDNGPSKEKFRTWKSHKELSNSIKVSEKPPKYFQNHKNFSNTLQDVTPGIKLSQYSHNHLLSKTKKETDNLEKKMLKSQKDNQNITKKQKCPQKEQRNVIKPTIDASKNKKINKNESLKIQIEQSKTNKGIEENQKESTTTSNSLKDHVKSQTELYKVQKDIVKKGSTPSKNQVTSNEIGKTQKYVLKFQKEAQKTHKLFVKNQKETQKCQKGFSKVEKDCQKSHKGLRIEKDIPKVQKQPPKNRDEVGKTPKEISRQKEEAVTSDKENGKSEKESMIVETENVKSNKEMDKSEKSEKDVSRNQRGNAKMQKQTSKSQVDILQPSQDIEILPETENEIVNNVHEIATYILGVANNANDNFEDAKNVTPGNYHPKKVNIQKSNTNPSIIVKGGSVLDSTSTQFSTSQMVHYCSVQNPKTISKSHQKFTSKSKSSLFKPNVHSKNKSDTLIPVINAIEIPFPVEPEVIEEPGPIDTRDSRKFDSSEARSVGDRDSERKRVRFSDDCTNMPVWDGYVNQWVDDVNKRMNSAISRKRKHSDQGKTPIRLSRSVLSGWDKEIYEKENLQKVSSDEFKLSDVPPNPSMEEEIGMDMKNDENSSILKMSALEEPVTETECASSVTCGVRHDTKPDHSKDKIGLERGGIRSVDEIANHPNLLSSHTESMNLKTEANKDNDNVNIEKKDLTETKSKSLGKYTSSDQISIPMNQEKEEKIDQKPNFPEVKKNTRAKRGASARKQSAKSSFSVEFSATLTGLDDKGSIVVSKTDINNNSDIRENPPTSEGDKNKNMATSSAPIRRRPRARRRTISADTVDVAGSSVSEPTNEDNTPKDISQLESMGPPKITPSDTSNNIPANSKTPSANGVDKGRRNVHRKKSILVQSEVLLANEALSQEGKFKPYKTLKERIKTLPEWKGVVPGGVDPFPGIKYRLAQLRSKSPSEQLPHNKSITLKVRPRGMSVRFFGQKASNRGTSESSRGSASRSHSRGSSSRNNSVEHRNGRSPQPVPGGEATSATVHSGEEASEIGPNSKDRKKIGSRRSTRFSAGRRRSGAVLVPEQNERVTERVEQVTSRRCTRSTKKESPEWI